MKHETKHKIASAVGLAMMGSSAVVAPLAQAVDVTSSVTLKNAITLTLTTPLSFGTIRANYNAGDAATLILSPNSASASIAAVDGNASINEIVKGTPAVLAIADAGPFSTITVSLPATDTNLVAAVGGAAPAQFVIPADSWKLRRTSGTAVDLVFNSTTDSAPIQVDGAGNATFAIGATLTTDDRATRDEYVLDETDYEGTFAVTVAY